MEKPRGEKNRQARESSFVSTPKDNSSFHNRRRDGLQTKRKEMKENQNIDRNSGICFENSCSLFYWRFCGLFHRQRTRHNWIYRSYGRLHLQRSCELTIVRCVICQSNHVQKRSDQEDICTTACGVAGLFGNCATWFETGAMTWCWFQLPYHCCFSFTIITLNCREGWRSTSCVPMPPLWQSPLVVPEFTRRSLHPARSAPGRLLHLRHTQGHLLFVCLFGWLVVGW